MRKDTQRLADLKLEKDAMEKQKARAEKIEKKVVALKKSAMDVEGKRAPAKFQHRGISKNKKNRKPTKIKRKQLKKLEKKGSMVCCCPPACILLSCASRLSISTSMITRVSTLTTLLTVVRQSVW